MSYDGIDIEQIAPPTLADNGRYEIRHELWRHGSIVDATEMHQTYTPDGKYIGDLDTAEYLCGDGWDLVWPKWYLPGWHWDGWRHYLKLPYPRTRRQLGVSPGLREPGSGVCTVGYSERHQKWYGWSHRAIAGFGVGFVIEEEHAAVGEDGWVGWAGEQVGLPVGFVAQDLDDARRLAVAFARWVS